MPNSFVTARIAAAAFLLLSACAAQPNIPPLSVRQAEEGEPVTPDPALALVSGRLGMAEDGKSMLPYYIGTRPGCVAGQVGLAILLLPLALASGGHSIGPSGGSCEQAAPALFVVHLESRSGASLSVTGNGLFSAQVPSGTYLVPEVEDNRLRIPATMVFQVPTPGQAYYLGDVELNFSGEGDKTRVLALQIKDNYLGGRAARLASVPAAQATGERKALLSTFTQYPGVAFFAGDKETAQRKWNAYLDQVVAELAAMGIRLLTWSATPLSDGVAAYDRGDYATALALWRPMAERGDPRAQFNLAILHDLGRGVTRDGAEAELWYRRAADQGYANAQASLGAMYEDGRGGQVPQNNVQAYLWFELAARAHPTGLDRNRATAGRERAARKMSADEIAEAKTLLDDWKPVTQ